MLHAFGRSVYSYQQPFNLKTTFEKGTFSLRLSQAREEDSAVFICLEISQDGWLWIFLKRVELTVADVSKPVHPGASSPPPRPTLENLTSCFPPGKFPSGPASVYTEGNHEYECGDEREGQSSSTCVYSFFMNTSLFEGGLRSVTSCGERSEAGAAGSNMSTNNLLYVGAAAALTVVLIVACLIHQPKNLVDLQTQTSDGLQAPLSHEHSVMCYTAVCSEEKAGGERAACRRRRSQNLSH
ncbi:uncharacterized protein LOC128767483 [Synchiropus splendidus]|uniref:uncharacterized protein LOC128767483 n=1 Tax=Synchiropus splendidus TaxID=270530 RepID=UPI00237EB9AA|nr:uncharacterized protein LOC128767483 [Synchiropus splendidus]